MKLRPRRAALTCALAATATALALTAPAQANTTIPGNNGKIAYTTNATLIPEFSGGINATSNSTRLKGCDALSLPIGALLTNFPFDVLYCNAEIATINPDGSGFTQVTNNNVPDDRPAWLPQDGSKLAYQSVEVDPECTRGSISCESYDLFDITPDGLTGHQLTSTPGPSDHFNSQSPSYSPDGSRIAFEALDLDGVKAISSRDFAQNPLFKQFDHLFSTIFTVPAGGETVGVPTPVVPADEQSNGPALVSDSQPTYSPDGSQIAFVRLTIEPQKQVIKASRGLFATLTSSIYVAPAGGGSSHPVESTPACDLTPQMLGSVLAQSATGAPVRSSRGGTVPGPRCTFDSAPAWSPDGSKIAVERVTFPELFVGLTDTRGVIEDPTSPFIDSDIVVFNSTDGSGETNLSDVTEGSGDCSDISVLKSGYACSTDQKPAWSPDSTKIAFFSDRDNTGLWPGEQCVEEDSSACDDEIWTMNADGSSPTQLTNNDVNDINPDWQRIQPPPVPPAQPASPVKPAVGVAGVRRACVAGSFHVRFRVTTANSSVKKVVVKLDGKRIKSTSKGSFTLTINGKKLKSGKHRLTITATNAAGQVTTTRKTFSVCKAAKPRRKAAPRFTG